tara:strand:+ start:15060 stop:15875 length:816 start_codon:yes stop_codon:yes gene_type:complete
MKTRKRGFSGGRKKYKSCSKNKRRKRKTRRRKKIAKKNKKIRKTRRKSGGSPCGVHNGECEECVNRPEWATFGGRCMYHKISKVCSKKTAVKKLNRNWKDTCDIYDLPLSPSAIPVIQPLRQETDGGTEMIFANALPETPHDVPEPSPELLPEPLDAGDSLEEQRRQQYIITRKDNLRRENGVINDNSRYQGTPCFTPCEHKGWCESGVSGACDWENYCYPSNNNGTGKIPNVKKQYCDNITPSVHGGRKKNKRRKKKTRKSNQLNKIIFS